MVDGRAVAEIGELEDRANLPPRPPVEGRAREPLDRLVLRLALPDPVAGDELLGLGERAVRDRAFLTVEADARTLRARLKTVTGEHHAGFHKLLVVLCHLGKTGLVGEDACL